MQEQLHFKLRSIASLAGDRQPYKSRLLAGAVWQQCQGDAWFPFKDHWEWGLEVGCSGPKSSATPQALRIAKVVPVVPCCTKSANPGAALGLHHCPDLQLEYLISARHGTPRQPTLAVCPQSCGRNPVTSRRRDRLRCLPQRILHAYFPSWYSMHRETSSEIRTKDILHQAKTWHSFKPPCIISHCAVVRLAMAACKNTQGPPDSKLPADTCSHGPLDVHSA